MSAHKRYVITCFFMLQGIYLYAQDITGTWEGSISNFEFLQVNIIQVKGQLCGYTWDYVFGNRPDHCKAYFTGRYDKTNKEWQLTGTHFIENSGSHILMHLNLVHDIVNGTDKLTGIEGLRSPVPNYFFSGSMDSIRLEKVSNRPTEILEGMYECWAENQKLTKEKRVNNVKPSHIDSVVKTVQPPTRLQSIPELMARDSTRLQLQMGNRKNIEMSHVTVNTKEITLNVYDNGIVDGDTVSIFYNGRLILSHQRLSEKPIVIHLKLDENIIQHKIVLFAENLGSIPPNTALIIVNAGDKRFELFSSSNLEENAVLVFEYKPG